MLIPLLALLALRQLFAMPAKRTLAVGVADMLISLAALLSVDLVSRVVSDRKATEDQRRQAERSSADKTQGAAGAHSGL